MAQQVQELIDKIKMEGVQAAEDQAKEIEAQAKTQAESMVVNAKKEAEDIVAKAKQNAEKLHESTKMALKQASRDTLLSLRKEIDGVLQKIILAKVSESLTAESLTTILEGLIKKFIEQKSEDMDIQVALGAKDLKALNEGFIAKLQKQVKKDIKFQSSEDIGAGFTISFDNGKSCFDFTDSSLAGYLGTHLNDQVANLVNEASA